MIRVTTRRKETPQGTLRLRESTGPLGRGADLPGEAGGRASSGREVGRINQTGAPSGTAEQTTGDPLECGQEAGDEAQETWVCTGRLGTGGGGAPRAHGCAEGSGAGRGRATLCGPGHRWLVLWLHGTLVLLSRRLQNRHLQSEAVSFRRDHVCGLWFGRLHGHYLPLGVKYRSVTSLYPPPLN